MKVKTLIEELGLMDANADVSICTDPLNFSPNRAVQDSNEIAGFSKEELRREVLQVSAFGEDFVLIHIAQTCEGTPLD